MKKLTDNKPLLIAIIIFVLVAGSLLATKLTDDQLANQPAQQPAETNQADPETGSTNSNNQQQTNQPAAPAYPLKFPSVSSGDISQLICHHYSDGIIDNCELSLHFDVTTDFNLASSLPLTGTDPYPSGLASGWAYFGYQPDGAEYNCFAFMPRFGELRVHEAGSYIPLHSAVNGHKIGIGLEPANYDYGKVFYPWDGGHFATCVDSSQQIKKNQNYTANLLFLPEHGLSKDILPRSTISLTINTVPVVTLDNLNFRLIEYPQASTDNIDD